MRWVYRLVLALLLSFMFRTPILRFYQSTRHFINIIPDTLQKPAANPATASNMSRPSGLIASKGFELLTFGTPNGMSASRGETATC